MATTRICSIEGCGKKHYGRGYCQMHHMRLWVHGDPTTVKGHRSAGHEFYENVARSYSQSDCLFWPYANVRGYPVFNYAGKRWLVTRLLCKEIYGDPPSAEFHAAHSCGNGHLGCVNPLHLRWASLADNTADRVRAGVERQKLTGYRTPSNAKYHPQKIRQILEDARPAKMVAAEHGIPCHTVYYLRRRWKRVA